MKCITQFLNSGLTVKQAKDQSIYVYHACNYCKNKDECKK